MERVNAVLVVANDLSEIKGEVHKAYLIGKEGGIKRFEGVKKELAQEILKIIEKELLNLS